MNRTINIELIEKQNGEWVWHIFNWVGASSFFSYSSDDKIKFDYERKMYVAPKPLETFSAAFYDALELCKQQAFTLTVQTKDMKRNTYGDKNGIT